MRRRPGRYGSYPTSRRGVSRILGHSMDLTWLGHACFRMRGREGVVLTDPPDPKVVVPMSYDPDDKKKDTPFQRLLHELGVKELTPVPKLSVTRSSLPENVQVVALDSRAR